MNLVNYNLEAQILEIEAQVKVKNSDISDLESMMNNKVRRQRLRNSELPGSLNEGSSQSLS